MAGRIRSQRRPARRAKLTAATADKYDLYQRTVQEPEVEIEFFDRVFRRHFGRRPVTLREDFCGTAAVCCQWVRSRKGRTALGVDLDPEPIEWCRLHNLPALKPAQRQRVTFALTDVRSVDDERVDVLAAQNFSFWCFKTRPELRGYFEAAHRNLADEGVFVLDMMGGSETMEDDRKEVREYPGYRYIWEHRRFDPITHDIHCAISFRFTDGTQLKRVFEYRWRLWTLPEVTEVLHEAGFRRADVYWEGTDRDTGEGDGVYRRRKHASADPSWIAYVVGVK